MFRADRGSGYRPLWTHNFLSGMCVRLFTHRDHEDTNVEKETAAAHGITGILLLDNIGYRCNTLGHDAGD